MDWVPTEGYSIYFMDGYQDTVQQKVTRYVNERLVYDSRILQTIPEYALVDPILTLEVNQAGSLEFSMEYDHPRYSDYQVLLTIVEVRDNEGRVLFRGRILNDEVGLYGAKKIFCEGELACFNDCIVRPFNFEENGIRADDFFYMLIDAYVAGGFHHLITAGTARDRLDHPFPPSLADKMLYLSGDGSSTVMDELSNLNQEIGGHIFYMAWQGTSEAMVWYVDSNDVEHNRSDQEIRLSRNLIDYVQKRDASEIYTVIVPRGKRDEDDNYLTVESITGGADWIPNDTMVGTYGKIERSFEFSEIEDAQELYDAGVKQMMIDNTEVVNLTIKAVDLRYVDGSARYTIMKPGIWVPLSFNDTYNERYVFLTKATYNLADASKDEYQFGEGGASISGMTASSSGSISGFSGNGPTDHINTDMVGAHKAYIGPLSGSATPTFRLLETSDVPSVVGTFPVSVSAGNRQFTVSISPATQSAAGSMSANDKKKLDTVNGAAPITATHGTGSLTIGINAATQSAAGSMSANDKKKLDTASGTAPITVTNTSDSFKIGINPATQSAAGSMSANDKKKLDSITGTSPIVVTNSATSVNVAVNDIWVNETGDTMTGPLDVRSTVTAYKFQTLANHRGYFLMDGSGTQYAGIYDNGTNLWIGATATDNSQHHQGGTFISSGHNGTTGNKTIYICVPTGPSPASPGGTNYAVFHAGYLDVGRTTDGILPIAHGGTSADTRRQAFNNLGYLGTNPLDSIVQDTQAKWKELGGGFSYVSSSDLRTHGQPSRYGFILSLVSGENVHQEFWTQNDGKHYYRGGNANTTTMPDWKPIDTDSQYNVATETSNGLMPASDKKKLNNIVGTSPITVNNATDRVTIGIGASTQSAAGYMSAADKKKLDTVNGTAPITATHGTGSLTIGINAATQSAPGYLSAADKTKIDNMVTGVKGMIESVYRTGNVNLTPANIGALALTGGTLTGAVMHEGANSRYDSSNLDISGSAPSERTYGNSRVAFRDKDDDVIGQILPYYDADGDLVLRVQAQRTIGSTTYTAYFDSIVTDDGERLNMIPGRFYQNGSLNRLTPAYRVLYDGGSSGNGTNGQVTLAETAANFTMLEIFYCCHSPDPWVYDSVKIYKPNGKVASLHLVRGVGNNTFMETGAKVLINGTKITKAAASSDGYGEGQYGWVEATGVQVGINYNNSIYIYGVIGYI